MSLVHVQFPKMMVQCMYAMTKDKVTALSSLFRYNKTIDYYTRSQYRWPRSGQVTLSAKSRGPHILVLVGHDDYLFILK
jgi:hypothetical protein